jgi:hypothetical protein
VASPGLREDDRMVGAASGSDGGVTPADTALLSRAEYFERLDRDPLLREKARADALGALLDLVVRADVPPPLELACAEQAGSPGGGRILLILDYTRGTQIIEPWGEALGQGPVHVIAAKVVTPMLTHFRYVGGESLFPGDAGFTRSFRDSPLWGPATNQVGHLLCAVEAGVRLGRFSRHPLERRAFELGLAAANRLAGLEGVEASVADWSRAGIIGHEMMGDEDGSGFLGQMRAYGKLIGEGDQAHVRAHWDAAVDAALRGDHPAAWRSVRAIAAAAEIPETIEEVRAARENPAPRFARAGSSREGNSVEDLALSVYGFAFGYRSMTRGYANAEEARAELSSCFAAGGSQAEAINRAADETR